MDTIQIGLLGMGTVGTGVLKLLRQNQSSIEQKTGVPVAIKTVLVRDPAKARQFTGAALTTDVAAILDDPAIQIVVEVMGGEQPALEYMLRAMNRGKHVVTANKDVVAKYGRELFAAAQENGVNFLFEASVAGGIPIIRPLKQCLAANRIHEVMGIVNGTTNYMLTKMVRDKSDFATVLAEAQAMGYAEANPAADVGGLDAARKIAILASIAFNSRVTFDDVYVEGITAIDSQDIEYAGELGYCIKLLAIAKDTAHGIDVRVHPAFLPLTHPLAAVHDVFNAIFVRGDAVGDAMFYGRGAGEMPTASAIMADVIDTARDIRHHAAGRVLCTCYDQVPICPLQYTEAPYYVRLLVEDRPGALAAIAGAFGAQQVSLHSVIQKRKVEDCAELVLITSRVPDAGLRLAVNTLRGMSVVREVENVIRVEAAIE
ncbi:MAG: homoserine dehydrogenase [Sporomusaceae bacterium]|nr:homoserine dehydrogenase [Sporomusaceae bacterium]